MVPTSTDRSRRIVWKNSQNGRSRKSRFHAPNPNLRGNRHDEAHGRATRGKIASAANPLAKFYFKVLYCRLNCDRREKSSFSTQSTSSGHCKWPAGTSQMGGSASTTVAWGSTGVRAEAANPLQARNRLHRPFETFLARPTDDRRRPLADLRIDLLNGRDATRGEGPIKRAASGSIRSKAEIRACRDD
jgi:hypothetical protein